MPSAPVGEPVERSWTRRTRCSTPSASAPADRPDRFELEFTTENSKDVTQQRAADLRRRSSAWAAAAAMPSVGTFNPAMLVHGEQAIELHRPIPVEGTSRWSDRSSASTTRARARSSPPSRRPSTKATGKPLFTHALAVFIRGEGGFGGDRGPERHRTSHRSATPDHEVDLPDPRRPGADLPPVGRPQPAALRPEFAKMARLRRSRSCTVCALRLHRPGAAAHPVRLRPGQVQGHGGPLLQAGDARATRSR